MNHTVGIIAHRAEPQLSWLIEDLEAQGFRVLVHADLKQREAILQQLGTHAGKVLAGSLDVQRAHISLVHAALRLMEAALEGPMDHFHLISGDDLLIKERSYVDHICGRGWHFLQHVALPIPADLEDTPQRKDRIPLANYRHFSESHGMELLRRNTTSPLSSPWLENRLGTFRTFWRIYNRLLRQQTPHIKYYCGSAWFSIGRALADHFVLQSRKRPQFLAFFERTRFPDELYFQTLALNSPFRSRLVNSDLRYIDWTRMEQEGPSILNEEDMRQSLVHPGIFARKWRLEDRNTFDRIIAQRHVEPTTDN